jgi:hypothetical protein
MDTKFKYFHWAIPKSDCEWYGLYDVLDNQFFLLTYDFDIAWQTKQYIKSKTILEIVDFSTQSSVNQIDIDNSVIEHWGLDSVPTNLFQDPSSQSTRYFTQDLYRQSYMIKDISICENKLVMTDFKKDLQTQIFFLHYCLWQAKHERNYRQDSIFYQHLLTAIELGQNYSDVLNRFLNFKESINEELCNIMIEFLRAEGMTYE